MSRKSSLARIGTFSAGVVLLIAAWQADPQGQAAQADKSIDAKVATIFSRWDSTSTPGCAIALAANGQPVLQKAYGMADLEHGTVITPDSIFEAGSVSKQFTAAAMLLLAREGKLSLDDPARKYLPELPEYRETITIRQMLQHVSGLRDWGTVAALGGWPRTTRVYTHAHVLDIVSRQTALNFEPGADWSYSNTGYNLAAIIVSRVAGEPFAEFTRKRLFEPLGMWSTSWRDDYARIVKGRAMAYSTRADGFETLMPFENVHGNGGLLTTVGDLLRWNDDFGSPKVGDASSVAEQQQSGRLDSGREHGYGLGLFLGTYRGVREVYHGGATAGYRAFLARYPDQHLSVAVLCNATSATPDRYAHAVVDLYLADRLTPEAAPPDVKLSAEELDSRAGFYRSRKHATALTIVRDGAGLRIKEGPALRLLSASTFQWGAGAEAEFAGSPAAAGAATIHLRYANGTEDMYERVERAQPSPDQLAQLVGVYHSDDADLTFTIAVDQGVLKIRTRPDIVQPLTPLYVDAFDAPIGTVIFHRDAKRRVIGLSVALDRAWDVRFERVSPAAPARE